MSTVEDVTGQPAQFSIEEILAALRSESDWDEEFIKVFGKFNDYPPNWKEITPDRFWSYFNTYGSGPKQSFRQIRRGPQESLLSVHMFLYAGGHGLAVHVDWNYRAKYENPPQPEYVPTFYEFAACEHNRVETKSTQRGWHEGHCTKCGFVMNYDSGD